VGGLAKSTSLTGCAFSGGSVLVGFPVTVLVGDAGADVVSGAGDIFGLEVVVVEGVTVGTASLFSAVDLGDGAEDVDCAHAIGEEEQTMARAKTRCFIAVENLLDVPESKQLFTLTRTLQGARVLTLGTENEKSRLTDFRWFVVV
jgi:hypothetical protein